MVNSRRFIQQWHFIVLALLSLPTTTAFSHPSTSGRKLTVRSRDNIQPPSSSILQQASVALPEYLPDDPTTTNNVGIRPSSSGAAGSLLVPSTGRRKVFTWIIQRMRGGGVRSWPAPQQLKTESFLKRHPFLSAVCITTMNAILADVMTQLVFSRAATAATVTTTVWNWKRTLVFGAFGCLYQGMVQYAIVNGVWEKVFPGTSARNVLAKICAMNLLSDPLFFMPTFYIFQQCLLGSTMVGAGMSWHAIRTALLSYKANCWMDWRNSWMVWFPGHAVTYGVMPSHKRIPWMAFLSFFYMCVLSLTRG